MPPVPGVDSPGSGRKAPCSSQYLRLLQFAEKDLKKADRVDQAPSQGYDSGELHPVGLGPLREADTQGGCEPADRALRITERPSPCLAGVLVLTSPGASSHAVLPAHPILIFRRGLL